MRETGNVPFPDIPCPGSPDRCKGSAMGAIKPGAQGMSQLVNREILLPTQSSQIIMGKASAPHQFTHGIVIIRALHCHPSAVNNRPKQSFRNFVCHSVFLIRNEIPLQSVHHNVRYPTSNLVFRERIGKLRIHDCKNRSVQLCPQTKLLSYCLIGQNGRVARLASCCRDGQYGANL